LTDASALVFDEDTKELGITAHAATTPEIQKCCEDLKVRSSARFCVFRHTRLLVQVLGKPDFKLLLKWRFLIRRALPDVTKLPHKPEASGERKNKDGEDSGSEAENGSEAEGESGGDDEDEDSSEVRRVQLQPLVLAIIVMTYSRLRWRKTWQSCQLRRSTSWLDENVKRNAQLSSRWVRSLI
jgi:hypothetical protein